MEKTARKRNSAGALRSHESARLSHTTPSTNRT